MEMKTGMETFFVKIMTHGKTCFICLLDAKSFIVKLIL